MKISPGTRLVLRSLIQFATGGVLTALLERLGADLGLSVEYVFAIITMVTIVLQNLAEDNGITWVSPVNRPDKVDAA